MKLLLNAIGTRCRHLSIRAWMLGLATLGALMPAAAFADEGSVKLNFTGSDKIYLVVSGLFGILAILTGIVLAKNVLTKSAGNEKMQEVGLAIREGALAYLRKQVATMSIFVVILAVGLVALYWKDYGPTLAMEVAVSFVGGVAASYIAGYAGMLMAVAGNMRTAHAALSSYKDALEIAFRSGAVAGMITVGMGLIGATAIFFIGGADAVKLLIGFGFGGSLAALFMRVGGGIFTKAADVGADLVGKVEAGIPEDDPRNPATIADNVGDNVGDCAGMAADVFESYEVTLVAAIVLGAATSIIFDEPTWMKLILFALMARGVGIVASIIGIYSVKGTNDIDADPLKRIRSGFYSSAGVAALGTLIVAWFMMGGKDPAHGIVSSKLNALEPIQQAGYSKIQRALRDVSTADAAPENMMKNLQKNADIVAMGLDNDQYGNTLQRAMQFDLKNAAAPRSLERFHRLDPDGTEKELDWAIQKPLTADQNSKPSFYTVREWLKSPATHIYVVKVDVPERAIPGDPQKRMQKANTVYYWIPPITRPDLDQLIAKAVSQPQAPKMSVVDDHPVSIWADADSNLAFGIDGKVDHPMQVELPQIVVYRNSVDYVQTFPDKSKTDHSLEPPSQVKNYQLALVGHTTVPWWTFWIAIVFGVLMAFAIEALTDYYVSTHKRPVRDIAEVATAGPAPMIIQGFSYAAESSVFMVFAIVIALLLPLYLFPPTVYGSYIMSFYGIALVGLGLLTTTGYVLAMDTFGPISDNAQGVFEMSGAGHDSPEGSKAVQRLDAAGNTTKALTKGFAITTAVVAAVALFHSYLGEAKLDAIGLRLDVPEIFLGLLIGGAAPFLFSAFAINAVGRSAVQLIVEVRRQFAADPGIMAGTSKPDYGRCVAMVTSAAQKELMGPGILAIALPVAVAFGFSIGKEPTIINSIKYNLTGAQALGGFLAGAILSGQLMAVLLANSGGMWDNAKKLIEDGMHGGKGTEAHKAGIVCDTVGDPFKDTAGPAMNPLIKVMNLVALLLAAKIIQPFSDPVLIAVTAVAIAALAFSIWFSKKGSLSEGMTAASAGGPQIVAMSAPSAEPVPPKRKITVEEDVPPVE